MARTSSARPRPSGPRRVRAASADELEPDAPGDVDQGPEAGAGPVAAERVGVAEHAAAGLSVVGTGGGAAGRGTGRLRRVVGQGR